MTMTNSAFTIARAKLPPFAKGLGRHAVTLIALRDAVSEEIAGWRRGENSLTTAQIEKLELWLRRTA